MTLVEAIKTGRRFRNPDSHGWQEVVDPASMPWMSPSWRPFNGVFIAAHCTCFGTPNGMHGVNIVRGRGGPRKDWIVERTDEELAQDSREIISDLGVRLEVA